MINHNFDEFTLYICAGTVFLCRH